MPVDGLGQARYHFSMALINKKIRFSNHCLLRMSQRGIKKEYIARAVDSGRVKFFPKWYDMSTGKYSKNVKEFFIEIPEKGSLFVIMAANYGLIVTAYFDIPLIPSEA